MKTRRDDGPRRWDSYDAYLFDIDGTLLNCSDAVHYFAFCSVLSDLAGREMNLDGVTAHGNTDIGIVRDALALAGIAEDAWRPLIPNVRERMCRYVSEHQDELCVSAIAGVDEALRHLRKKGATLGVATGNLEQIGRMKLRHCGLLEHFDFGSYSDKFEHRADVINLALEMARQICGEDAAVCTVGDTPADIRAARANGLDVIAVATGIYSLEQLSAESPDWCLTSLQQLFPEGVDALGIVPQ
jgi:phosphoglycolate phosphatase-like HAD superfamily hydrolase